MFDVHEWTAPVYATSQVPAGPVVLTVSEHTNGLVMVETVVPPPKRTKRAREADRPTGRSVRPSRMLPWRRFWRPARRSPFGTSRGSP